MQICNLFTQPAKPKSKVLLPSYVYCIYCLSTKNFTPKKLLKKRRHNDNDVCQFVSNSIFELKKPTNHRRIFQKIWHSFFRKKPAKTPDFRESPAKSPETPRKNWKITPRDGYRRRKRLEITFSAHRAHAQYRNLAENIYCFTWNDAAKANERRFSARHRKIPPFTQFSLLNCAVRHPAIYFGSINLDRNRQKPQKVRKGRCCS